MRAQERNKDIDERIVSNPDTDLGLIVLAKGEIVMRCMS